MKRKDEELDKVCEFCRFATAISGAEEMLCETRGVVAKSHGCRRFVYDPLKRVPRRLPELIIPEDL